MKWELRVGLLLFAFTMISKMYLPVPELVMGITLGLSLCLEIVGSLPDERYEQLKQAKKRIIKKFTR